MEYLIKEVDYQKIFFLEETTWNHLFEEGKYDNFDFSDINKYLKDFKEKQFHLANEYDDLEVGVGSVGIKKKPVLYTFYKSKDNSYHRVHIEKAKCTKCKWFGYIGNPKVFEIYIGIPLDVDKFTIMGKSDELSIKKCPKCQNESFKDAVWISN